MEGSEWLDAVKLIGGALAVIIIGAGGFFQGRRDKKTPPHSMDGDVVAATFTERSLMERLTSALLDVRTAILASTAETARVADLLEQDAHRREIEAEVRQALKGRGIVE
ncbi:MAG TPA: hypothetical protein VIO38_17320 [Rariglobus sp.]